VPIGGEPPDVAATDAAAGGGGPGGGAPDGSRGSSGGGVVTAATLASGAACAAVGGRKVPLVLGIGASTSGCSIEIRDSDDGRLYASGRGEVAKHANTVDPADWWHALVDARRSSGGALPVAAVGAAAPTDALIVVDDEGRPLCPARLGSDPDAAADAADLR